MAIGAIGVMPEVTSMRRATRLLWVVLGVCLLVGAATLAEKFVLPEMHALVVWMLVFAAYWTRRSRIKRD